MSISLAVAVNVLADLALLGVLAYVMSRARLLTPHVSATHAATPRPLPTKPARSTRPTTRSSSTAHPAQA